MGKSGLVPDNTNIKKTSGTPNLFFDSKNNVEYEKNQDNIIYKVTSTQLPAMVGGAFADVYLSKGNIREPHWHPNAWELDVIISGEAQISIVDPDTNKLHTYNAKPGQVVFIPMGWWHWITAASENLHMHLFFNNDQFETALGSNMLRLTPPEVYELSYGVNAEKIEDVLSPIKEAVEIGPPKLERTKQKQEEIVINISGKNVKL
ncbi:MULTISPECIES: cupin domain-containing protein [Bacillaceae]|uniref:cupin domain-containing protein n=1 Tax=Bacillaceae TaxID=186817 RepID=UPI001E345D46|nr:MULTISPECIES: cupin domain-containing protein [Bacillaceae]MCE4051139.1 cupin domain-containing protein [Bacillus sp. Au-Bac7]MCM3030256.1 cupin domain-containing protein [Niallia sp. MER 6]MDL0436863.1 cupin domain-containing protein [Niallia sp. SS-2023]UPO88228.1 cupin domain-containing protein [Niallia sp. Man26]